ncbi:MAG: hypothetical protein RLZZ116_1552 [Planctomycetota bacterium]|jgi:hypothetical protein
MNRALLARLNDLDRRWIFLAMGLSIAIPILLKLRFPEYPGPMARATFDAVEAVPEGSPVLISFDYDPASAAELQPMASALVHHCASRKLKMVFMALWPLGKQQADRTIESVLKQFHPGYDYGTDYVQLGYQSGNEGVIKLMATNVPEQYKTDAAGTATSTIPLLASVRDLSAFKLVASVSAGYPGAKEWVQYGNGPMPDAFSIVGGSTGVQVSQLLPYYPKQMEGMLVAVKGAAEYEMLVEEKYPIDKPDVIGQGRVRMGPQLVAHLLMIALIVLGNVAMIASRNRGGAR